MNADAWEDEGKQEDFKPLTREQAQSLRDRQPMLTPWTLVAGQAAAGGLMVALWFLFTWDGSKAWSALYGAIAVVLPNAVMAWGMSRRPARHAGAVLFSLMLWESIKILGVIAILVAVVLRVHPLSWPALLSTLVVTMKVYWLVLLRQGRRKSISTIDGN